MHVPLHPAIVHFPLALTFILPILIIVFALMIRAHKMHPLSWLIIIGLQATVVVTGYLALETGETEEERVEKVVSSELIHKHENAAEIFVGSTVLVLALSIAAFFIRKEISFPLKIAISLLTLISSYLAFNSGELGAELVYEHGAASAYIEERPALLPTPGQTTSESPTPVNESLNADENDYGNSDEALESDEDSKQED
jgi:uncharacterized membrane protein